MDGKDFKKQETKELSVKGKQKLLEALEEFINAKIDFRTLPVRPSLNQEQVEERLTEAKEALQEMFMALEIRLE